MSELHKAWKLLLNKSFWESHKDTIPRSSFDAIGSDLLPTLALAHEKSLKDITEDELLVLHLAQNPTLTTANKNTIAAYIDSIKLEKPISPEIADIVYKALWRREVGRHVSEYGIRLSDGEYEDTEGLSEYVAKLGAGLVPDDFEPPVDSDPVKLFAKLNEKGKWKINIPTIDKKVGNLSPGMFVIVLARPECGKSAFEVNMVAGQDGFAAQGAKTHILCNEEHSSRILARCICCYNQQSIHEVLKSPEMAATQGWTNVSRNISVVHKPDITVTQLERYLKKHKPDVLFLDQIDNIQISGNYESGHEKLGELYRRCRELASIHNVLIIAITQASADAEGKTVVTYSMMSGSKTSKSAAADAVIGLGRSDGIEDTDVVLRYVTLSKNKISGWRGTAVVKLIQSESRFIA